MVPSKSSETVLGACPWVHGIRPWLFQAGWGPLKTGDIPAQAFTHIVVLHRDPLTLPWHVVEEVAPGEGPTVLSLQVEDGDPIPDLEVVYARLRQAERVLVVCRAGMSRSASLCVGLLCAREGLRPEEALAVVAEALRPAPGFASRFEPAWGTLSSVLRGQIDPPTLRRVLTDLDVDFIDAGGPCGR